jgi:two-component system, NarL family, nitrate/nitrite response regulator NarL
MRKPGPDGELAARSVRILIWFRQQTFQDALAALLISRGHAVVGCATSAAEAAELVRRELPEVIVTGLETPGEERCGTIRQRQDVDQRVPLVVLSASADLQRLRDALKDGADGVVLQAEGIDELERVMQRVCSPHPHPGENGDRGQGPAEKVWSRGAQSLSRSAGASPSGVTPRGRTIIDLLARGEDTSTISSTMGIAPATVRSHIQKLFQRFGVHSRGALVAVAMREGLLEAPSSPSAPGADIHQTP